MNGAARSSSCLTAWPGAYWLPCPTTAWACPPLPSKNWVWASCSICLMYSLTFLFAIYRIVEFRLINDELNTEKQAIRNTYLGRTDNKVGQQLVLSSALERLKTIWFGLKDLGAMINRWQYNRLKWSDFEVLSVVNLIKDVEGNYTLTFGQQVGLQKVADIATDLEPLGSNELHVELLDALVEGFCWATR